MNERLKELRKRLNMTQQQFADKLGIKRGAIANYEIGRNVPIDAVISLICREFNVDENWLRTGSGDMFLPYSKTQAITKFAENLMEEPDSFKKRLIEGLAALDADDWNDLEKIAVKLSSHKKEKKICKEPTLSEASAKSIDEKVEDYRHQLELEEKAKEKSSVLPKDA